MRTRSVLYLLFLLIAMRNTLHAQIRNADSVMVAGIYNEVLTKGECYSNLRFLCKDIGHRLAGSESADKAITWGRDVLASYQPDTVFLMEVEVPHWSRGNNEFASYKMQSGAEQMEVKVDITALGGSVGTDGILQAQVVEVKSFDELTALGETQVKGKIVFFNKAMDAALINTGAAYGGAYPIRGDGPSEAAKLGAVGCIIRSLTLADDRYPHTGATKYQDGVTRIPAGALSSVASRQLSADLKKDPNLIFTMHLSCVAYERRIQHNVIAEIRGTDFPDEYITIGGHLDSWDIGEGAHDDGAGIVHSIEVLRTLRAVGYKPRHSIRIVLFINEEFGNDGGETYARVCKEQGLIHVAAIESDAGGFTPMGFNAELNDHQFAVYSTWKPLLETFGLYVMRRGGSGVDIRPLKKDDDRIALFGLNVDGQRYFDYHHSNNDRFENVNERELKLGAAAMSSLVYLLDQSGLPASE